MTAVFQVQVNMTFLKYPNWQLGIIRQEEEDTVTQDVLGTDEKVWTK